MDHYLDFAVALAKQAGKMIKDEFHFGTVSGWKQDKSPVTDVDFAINKLIEQEIKKEFPEHGIITEESAPTPSHTEYNWVCDPLDGTIAFTHGIPTCVFTLSLVKNGTPILGVIYDPFIERLFFAQKGKGAFLNNVSISVSTTASLENTASGITIWNRARYDCIPIISKLKKEDSIPFNLGSTVYMGALVANGEFATVIYPDVKPYDAAAIKIIVEEAGGKVTDLFGNEQRYDGPIKGMVASNSMLHDQLIKITKEISENK